MKVFISADIEGSNGIADWSESDKDAYFNKRMTMEVAAVCKGVNDFNANAEILVKDAHGSGRNIDHELLPDNVLLNRAFSGHPLCMMNLLDSSFRASILTGYHSPAYAGGNPMAHTMTMKYRSVKINELVCSEFLISYYTSLYYGVPLVMVSGDKELCQIVKSTDTEILTVETVCGLGASVTSVHPEKSRIQLRETAKAALNNADRLRSTCTEKLPKSFAVEISFREHKKAFLASHYPNAVQTDAHTILYSCTDFMDVLRLMLFV